MSAPKKYIKINGVMKLNPEYKRWKEAHTGFMTPGTTVARPSQALPIISSMQDHEELNEIVVAGGGQEIPLSESTNATIESTYLVCVPSIYPSIHPSIHFSYSHISPV